jgi:hypothetical protein
MKSGWALFVAVLIIVAGAFWWFSGEELSVDSGVPESLKDISTSRPTDFAAVGTITMNAPGQTRGVPYFIYDIDTGTGKTGSVEIEFDTLSFCGTNTGMTPCVAMSATVDAAFAGKRIVLDGEKTGTMVLVRKLQAIPEGQPLVAPAKGRTYISWPQARALIDACRVSFAAQSHALDVELRLANNQTLYTVEPNIDNLFSVLERVRDKCGNIPVATE